MSDDKAKDILDQLSRREVCGDAVVSSVGRRAWERPRVAVSGRLYKQYRVSDPWDPAAKAQSADIGLGPVSLRLGQKKRQPAPHLQPKAPKQPKQQATRDPLAGLPNVPKAKPKARPPDVKSQAAAPKATTPEVDAKAAEIRAKMRAAEEAMGGVRRTAPAPAVGPSQPPIPPAPPIPVRPEVEAQGQAPDEQGEIAKTSDSKGRGSSGRFRMAASRVTNAPVVRRRVEPKPQAESAEPGANAPPVPPPRRPMPTGGAATMDDFFSAAAQMGRLSMPKREPVEPVADEE